MVNAIEMSVLRKIEVNTRRDRTRNETVKKHLRIAPIRGKIFERQLRWFGHVNWMTESRLTKRVYETKI